MAIASRPEAYLTLLEEHRKDTEWFLHHYRELVKKYDGEFVAVFEGNVVGHHRDLSALMREIRGKMYPRDPFVDLVTSEKRLLVV